MVRKEKSPSSNVPNGLFNKKKAFLNWLTLSNPSPKPRWLRGELRVWAGRRPSGVWEPPVSSRGIRPTWAAMAGRRRFGLPRERRAAQPGASFQRAEQHQAQAAEQRGSGRCGARNVPARALGHLPCRLPELFPAAARKQGSPKAAGGSAPTRSFKPGAPSPALCWRRRRHAGLSVSAPEVTSAHREVPPLCFRGQEYEPLRPGGTSCQGLFVLFRRGR